MPFKFANQTISVSAPSRLHFGLLSIGDVTTRQFGGAGVMIDSPRTMVSVSASETFVLEADPSLHEAIESAYRNWKCQFASVSEESLIDDMPVRIKVNAAPRHCGLGSGTQLAFSVATALQIYFDQPIPSSEDLALGLGRGKRSAIGSYGFLEGGFLVDRGIEHEAMAPLDMRTDFPDDWKIALIQLTGTGAASVYGDAEIQAFQDLPATTQAQADKLVSLLKDKILPSVLSQDFSIFADAVTQYGYESGMHYSPVMGGPYASGKASRMVDRIRGLGQFAVGQSSWGPTIFAIGPSEKDVNWLVENLGKETEDNAFLIDVVSADNRGMTVDRVPNS